MIGLLRRRLEHRVLIYPYWNVNEKITEIKDAGKRVLIYPYWNVNVIAKTSETAVL